MSQIKSVVVFCGGSDGRKAIFTEEAYKMGQLLAENNIKVIYGAGGSGMMRTVAEGALDADGYVIGSTIQSLFATERPDLATRISKMEVFQTMYERKVSMTKQADAFWKMVFDTYGYPDDKEAIIWGDPDKAYMKARMQGSNYNAYLILEDKEIRDGDYQDADEQKDDLHYRNPFTFAESAEDD